MIQDEGTCRHLPSSRDNHTSHLAQRQVSSIGLTQENGPRLRRLAASTHHQHPDGLLDNDQILRRPPPTSKPQSHQTVVGPIHTPGKHHQTRHRRQPVSGAHPRLNQPDRSANRLAHLRHRPGGPGAAEGEGAAPATGTRSPDVIATAQYPDDHAVRLAGGCTTRPAAVVRLTVRASWHE